MVTAFVPYDDLPRIAGLDLPHAWEVFGPDDRLGTLNHLSPSRRLEALTSVQTGEVISLDLPLNEPDPPLFGRRLFSHHVTELNRNELDDYLDGFHPQQSTQWDALCHVRCREHGFYGGRDQDTALAELGIDQWAPQGIVGRGVLIDLARWANGADRAALPRPAVDPLTPHAFTAQDVIDTLAYQQTDIRPGDIVCLRTGWSEAYRQLDPAARAVMATDPQSAGLRADEATARLFWDYQVAAVAADNPAVENVPGDPRVGSLHRRLIPLLGFALGELFDFSSLARRCAEDGRWTFFFSAAPLNLPGGVGSPGHALALR